MTKYDTNSPSYPGRCSSTTRVRRRTREDVQVRHGFTVVLGKMFKYDTSSPSYPGRCSSTTASK
ncbi:hypothetical protein IR135_04020 [Jeotgalicoccus nanhaiensis]|uniref:Uncharacterized protein n=1 Tax=Jeotgalicoccus nanhaiensis TaxID=568603 RepID=A0ABR9XXX0_9STAP|nr:hypothetical protein [Jeotgalicoccus nanhaiensis]